MSGDVAGRPRCVYPMTQSQIGLSPNPNVPDLVEQLLPSNHAAHSARFLRRWLAVPPPPRVADQMQELVRRLSVSSAPLPSSLQPYPVGKVVSLLGARQANVGIFREVLQCSASVKTMLEPTISNLDAQESGNSKGRGVEDNTTFEPLVPPLLALTSHETGVVAERGQFLRGCTAVVNAIRDVVQLEDQVRRKFCDFPVARGFPSPGLLFFAALALTPNHLGGPAVVYVLFSRVAIVRKPDTSSD